MFMVGLAVAVASVWTMINLVILAFVSADVTEAILETLELNKINYTESLIISLEYLAKYIYISAVLFMSVLIGFGSMFVIQLMNFMLVVVCDL